MFKKNSYSSIFGSCYQPAVNTDAPFQSAKVSQNESLKSKQGKISLKKKSAHSARSNASCRRMKDITQQVVQQENRDNAQLKWLPFQNTKLLLNEPSHSKLYATSLHHTSTLTSQHPSAANLIHFQHPPQTKQDLQKTVRAAHCQRQRVKSHKTQNIGVHQKKVLDKKAFISHLISYRESLVSINDQNEACAKLQESQIMLDFFNPSESKVDQIHNYLSLPR